MPIDPIANLRPPVSKHSSQDRLVATIAMPPPPPWSALKSMAPMGMCEDIEFEPYLVLKFEFELWDVKLTLKFQMCVVKI
jgi:hypothetical protein